MKSKNKILQQVLNLLSDFVNRKISAEKYEKEYSKLWRFIRDKNIGFGYKTQVILDQLFSDCDMFCSDIKLRGKYYLTSNELRTNVKKYLRNLKSNLPTQKPIK